jgi:hypothetical protein
MADECSELYYIDQKVESEDAFSTIVDLPDKIVERILEVNKEYWDIQEYLESVIHDTF